MKVADVKTEYIRQNGITTCRGVFNYSKNGCCQYVSVIIKDKSSKTGDILNFGICDGKIVKSVPTRLETVLRYLKVLARKLAKFTVLRGKQEFDDRNTGYKVIIYSVKGDKE